MIRSDRLLIDLSQFVAEPYASGVQRVLHGLIPRWRHDLQPADVGFELDGWIRIVPTEAAAQALDLLFSPPVDEQWEETAFRSAAVHDLLAPHVALEIPRIHSTRIYGGYLLPEPTYRSIGLDTLDDWIRVRPDRALSIVYDALPQLEPWAFNGPEQVHTSRYYRLVSQMSHISAISASTKRQVERLARRSLDQAVVHLPGADALGTQATVARAIPTIVAPGTIEPRKRIDLVLDGVAECWRNGSDVHLICIGKAGWADSSLMGRVRTLIENEPRFTWLPEASDLTMASEMRSASVVVYLSEHEGYGLPPAEALALGSPVIASSKLPLFEHVGPAGQLRLDELTPTAVADAVEHVTDRDRNQALRSEARTLELPTWRGYADEVGRWAAAVMNRS